MNNNQNEIFAPYDAVLDGTLANGGDIVFRDEQEDAISKANKWLSKQGQKRKFLWNAKMRFGKTLCAMELVRRLGVKTTLIVTHRPVVDKGWREDFDKIFDEGRLRKLKEDLLLPDRVYKYGSHSVENEEGESFQKLTNLKDNCYGVYFVSLQYLALSEEVGGRNTEALKKDILRFPWDMVIVDEAHEGTQTDRGQNVLDALAKPETKMLYLSGTPFNLYDGFGDDEVYTWDYVMEQSAKDGWDSTKGPNPYLTLPRMNIFTYDLGKLVVGKDASFTFAEFFRTKSGSNLSADEQGKFVNEEWVNKFLDKLCEESATSNYPFSTETYRKAFNHTLWVVPGVKEAKALEELLKRHEIFSCFEIVNVAGANEDDEASENALDNLREKITINGRNTYSITLSCGRLTTGVTVPEWSAVFYLKGSENTSASTYMQTIFRTQSPYVFEEDGAKMYKSQCYVFDFAPDRSLKMLAETAKFSTLKQSQKKNAKNVGTHDDDIQKMKDFLKFCPVISLDGEMKEFDAERLFTQLNQVYIDRVVRNGFNDNSLYDVQALLELDAGDLNSLGDMIAKSTNLEKPPKAQPLPPEIQMTNNGLNGKGKPDQSTGDDDTSSNEDDEEKKRKKARREERDRRIKIIRGLALRVPLMMFGAEVTSESEEITRDNFTEKIDDRSWEEFMPRGVSKKDFNSIKTAFNQSIFTGAGKKIRQLAWQADDMTVTNRIQRIAEIFSYFHNPDKETVLTPWRVVNMHLSDTIGGYCFFNENFTGPNQIIKYGAEGKLFEYVDTNEPRFVNQEGVTEKVFFDRDEGTFDLKSKILEINSKTGLYPLYVAYTLFRARKADFEGLDLIENTSRYSVEEEQAIWDDILLDNIYVICNTEMAARITKRTLIGFRKLDESRIHIKHIRLVEEATKNQDQLVKKLKSERFWLGKGTKEMKFNAVVGNPPYQKMTNENGAQAKPIYNLFVDVARMLQPMNLSMIMPSRWMFGGLGLDDFRNRMLDNRNITKLHDFVNAKECFPNVDIKGGVCYFLYEADREAECSITTHNEGSVKTFSRYLREEGVDVFIRQEELVSIKSKVWNNNTQESLANIVSGTAPYGLPTNYFAQNTLSSIPISGGYEIVGLENGKRTWRYVDKNYQFPKSKGLGKYKIFVPKAYGCGAIGEVPSTPVLGTPVQACTMTFVEYGGWDDKEQAVNALKYLKTKFFRCLVSIKKQSQDATSIKYQYVPMQDFTSKSDIDWTKSIPEIDQQLYKKYNLTADEIAFIESNIKPME